MESGGTFFFSEGGRSNIFVFFLESNLSFPVFKKGVHFTIYRRCSAKKVCFLEQGLGLSGCPWIFVGLWKVL